MEGPSIRRFPRIALDKPVELRSGETAIVLHSATGNLSLGGLFVATPEPAPRGEVRLRISATRPCESLGVIRHFLNDGAMGVGIEFAELPAQARQDLEELIAELTREGAPAA